MMANKTMLKSNSPQYTAAEITSSAGSLPGFAVPADVYDIFENRIDETLWQPVLSATIVTHFDGKPHVLTGNRTSEGNATHVNVASTPTIRLPHQEAGLLLAESIPFCLDGRIDPLRPFVSRSLYPSVARIPDSTDPLSAKVGYLLALKLQLGTELETAKQAIGRASLARCIAGFSYLEDTESGDPLFEPIVMFGAIVGLEPETASKVPSSTSSYSHLGWVPIDEYVHGVATKTLAEVIPTATPADELEVCVRGLCNATSSNILSNASEIEMHLTENGFVPSLRND